MLQCSFCLILPLRNNLLSCSCLLNPQGAGPFIQSNNRIYIIYMIYIYFFSDSTPLLTYQLWRMSGWWQRCCQFQCRGEWRGSLCGLRSRTGRTGSRVRSPGSSPWPHWEQQLINYTDYQWFNIHLTIPTTDNQNLCWTKFILLSITFT